MLLECHHCGAPLDVKPGAWVATCAYCQRTQRLKDKTKAVPTPQDWRAPVNWTPPAAAKVHGVMLHYDPSGAARRTVRRVGCAWGVMIVVIGVIGLVPVLLPFLGNTLAAWRWDGSSTFECSGNEQKTIDGAKVKSSATPAISVRGNCQLTITSSRIRGDKLFEIAENGRVTVKDSELTTKRTLRVDGNFGIELVDSKLSVEGARVVFETNGNASVVLEASELVVRAPLDGELVIASSSGNGQVEIETGKIIIAGAKSIVLARGHRPFRWHGGSLEAQGRAIAVDGPYDVTDVELHGSQIGAATSEASATPSAVADDEVCARARACCHKVLGPSRCTDLDDMPPAGCAMSLRAYREAGQATGIQCD